MKFFIVFVTLLSALTSGVLAIVNGNNAGINQFPFMASIRATLDGGDYLDCTGVIVTKRHILTTAKCVIDSLGFDISYGATARNEFALPNRKATPFDGQIHNEYDTETKKNNIAILTLRKDIEFNDEVQPVKMDSAVPANQYIGTVATVIGFGYRVRKLQYASVTVQSEAQCGAADHELCAGSQSSGPCRGDAGAPLMSDGKQIGMFVDEFCGTQTPGTYIRIADYLPWIKSKTVIRE